jgi:DNA-directed RNA polymerase specialized sigma24 family protein
LTEYERTLLLLRGRFGYSLRETATLLHISYFTARRHYLAAAEKFKELY